MYAKPDLHYYVAKLSGLRPDRDIDYRISKDGKPYFEATAKARPADSSELRIALLGDIASGGKGFDGFVRQIAEAKPELLMLTGDLAQPNGTAGRYTDNFFPILNADGLLSHTVTAVCPGDRDISADKYDAEHDSRTLDTALGGMSYFCLWQQPLNGPGKSGGKNIPVVSGSAPHVEDFLSKAGKSYPASANYSFDWGNSHWLVLDGGAYVNWRDNDWRNWVREDLASCKKQWKFAVIHQPGFSSDTNHGEEQRMRYLCDLFEQNNVDIVFSAHSNSYQRSCPLHFTLSSEQDTDRESKIGFVYGKFKLDRSFNGDTQTHPDGVIYVITGGGGAEPQAERRIQDDTTRWQPFTKKFYSETNSFTSLDIDGRNLLLKQITSDGKVVDSIKISK
jgi:hypothetical protein